MNYVLYKEIKDVSNVALYMSMVAAMGITVLAIKAFSIGDAYYGYLLLLAACYPITDVYNWHKFHRLSGGLNGKRS